MSRLAIICFPAVRALCGMAEHVEMGATQKGAEAVIFDAAGWNPSVLDGYDAAAFGFAADSADNEAFLSFYLKCLPALCGKKVILFGTCRHTQNDFTESLTAIGSLAQCLMRGTLMTEGTPDAVTLSACEDLGGAAVRERDYRPDLAGVVPIIFSTITGNAYRLAAAVADVVPRHVGPYNIRYINDEVIEKFDTFILSYWCNHGTADDDTIALIRRLHGKNLIVIGTLGVAVTTAHAAKVCENVIALASADNHLLGHYLCQGSVDLNRTFARTRIPEGEKGHLSMERFEKQKLSLGHPNAEELEAARRAVAGFLANRQ